MDGQLDHVLLGVMFSLTVKATGAKRAGVLRALPLGGDSGEAFGITNADGGLGWALVAQVLSKLFLLKLSIMRRFQSHPQPEICFRSFENFEIKFWCFRWTLWRRSIWGCRIRFEQFVKKITYTQKRYRANYRIPKCSKILLQTIFWDDFYSIPN